MLLPFLEEGSEPRGCSLPAAQAPSSASSLSARSNLSPSFPFSLLSSCSDLLLSSPGARREAAGGERGEVEGRGRHGEKSGGKERENVLFCPLICRKSLASFSKFIPVLQQSCS